MTRIKTTYVQILKKKQAIYIDRTAQLYLCGQGIVYWGNMFKQIINYLTLG